MSETKTSFIEVTNISDSVVGYEIPEMHINRTYTLGETKKVTPEEVRQLGYLPGGIALMKDYLRVGSTEILEEFNIVPEEEYDWSEADVKNLLENESVDRLKDALDYAPEGIKDLIKSLAVTMELNNMDKRQAILDATGFNVTNAIQINRDSVTEDEAPAAKPGRRVVTDKAAPAAAGTRRVVSRGDATE